MPVVSGGGGGAAFNGGTIHTPLGITVTSAGAEVKALDLLDTSDTDAELWATFGTAVAGADDVSLSLAAGHDGKSRLTLSEDNFSGDVTLSSDNGLQLRSRTGVVTLFSSSGSRFNIVSSGALPTQNLVSATGTQLAARDVTTFTPVTFNPGAATTATCLVQVSPDNVTYSTLWTETVPAGVALDGTIHGITVPLPGNWYLKLTVNAQAAIGTTTWY